MQQVKIEFVGNILKFPKIQDDITLEILEKNRDKFKNLFGCEPFPILIIQYKYAIVWDHVKKPKWFKLYSIITNEKSKEELFEAERNRKKFELIESTLIER